MRINAMQNTRNGYERDPHLRRNDSLAHGSANTPGNRWANAMKDAPSFSEHMKQVRAGKAEDQNVFSRAAGNTLPAQRQENAFTKTTASVRSNAQTVSNNAIRSASNTQRKNAGANGHTAMTSRVLSADRAK